MTTTSHRTVRGRLRLAVAGAVMLTALTTGTAAATSSTARAGASPKAPVGPRSDTPVFVLDLTKGRFTGFDVPGPTAQDVTRINNRGQIVGGTREVVADEGFRGYLRDRRGRFTRIDVPGAVLWTQPFGINNRGQIVGYTTDGPGIRQNQEIHGFLLVKGASGPFTAIDVPGAPATGATGINDRGQIVGLYANPTATPSPQPTATPMGRMA